jgi:hypothetical protein
MKNVLSIAMRRATQLTRKQNVIEATRAIKRALTGQDHTLSPDEQSAERSRLIELQTNVAASLGAFEQPRRDVGNASAGLRDAPAERRPSARMIKATGRGLNAVASG